MSYNQWVTECPRCHDRDCLAVSEVAIASTGEKLSLNSRLYSDGFEVGDPGASTEDEEVRCNSCGETFDLDDLGIEER